MTRNCCYVLDESYHGSTSKDIEKQKVMVEIFARALRSQPDQYEKVFPLTTTRVPVLKFTHKSSQLRGELAFRSGMSTQNSKLVK